MSATFLPFAIPHVTAVCVQRPSESRLFPSVDVMHRVLGDRGVVGQAPDSNLLRVDLVHPRSLGCSWPRPWR